MSYQPGEDGLVWFHGQDSNGIHLREYFLQQTSEKHVAMRCIPLNDV